MTYFSQMAGLAVQNFISAAVGIVVVIALIRGIVSAPRRQRTRQLLAGPHPHGRSTCCCRSRSSARCCSSPRASSRRSAAPRLHTLGGDHSTLALRPGRLAGGDQGARDQRRRVLQRQLGDAVREPTGLSNFVEMLADPRDPGVADLHLRAHGRQPPPGLGDLRRRWPCCSSSRSSSSTRRAARHRRPSTGRRPHHHRRHRPAATSRARSSASASPTRRCWAVTTTVTSCGAVNAAFESLTGLGGLVPMANLALGEAIFGGVGTGLYSMLLFVLLAVFIGGLMVGRTPEYLGKKIEAREIKLVVDRHPRSRRWPCWSPRRSRSARSTGRRRSSPPARRASPRSLYAYMSQANNNGSAFAGYTGYFQPERRQPRRPRHHVRRPRRRPDDGARAASCRSLSCSPSPARWPTQEGHPGRPRHDAHRHADVRRPAARRRAPDRRAHVLPRAAARPDRPGPDRPRLF